MWDGWGDKGVGEEGEKRETESIRPAYDERHQLVLGARQKHDLAVGRLSASGAFLAAVAQSLHWGCSVAPLHCHRCHPAGLG